MNMRTICVAFVATMFATLLIFSSEMKMSQAAPSGKIVHTPVVEEIRELTDVELLKLEEELGKTKKESGKFTKGVLWKIEKDNLILIVRIFHE